MNNKKNLLIFIPAVLFVGLIFFITVLRYEPLFPKKNAAADAIKFSIPFSATDPILGLKRAGKTIVAFEDFGCHSCQQADAILSELMAAHPNTIKIIFKGLPVTRFPYPSEMALKYGFCANAQKKFLEFKNQAFALSDQLSETVLKKIALEIGLDQTDLDTCLASQEPDNYLTQNKNAALLLNIQSVPTFFINNKQIATPGSVAAWENILGIKQ